MRYQLRQKFWTLTNDFTIQDHAGRDVVRVTGKFFSFGHDLTFRDMGGQELLRIKQQLLNWGPTFAITQGDTELAVVKKHLFTFFNCKFTVDVPGPDDLEATGSFLEHDYRFERHGEPVAQVSKQWLTLTDYYGVDIAPGENDALILASVVVIDLCCHDGGDD